LSINGAEIFYFLGPRRIAFCLSWRHGRRRAIRYYRPASFCVPATIGGGAALYHSYPLARATHRRCAQMPGLSSGVGPGEGWQRYGPWP